MSGTFTAVMGDRGRLVVPAELRAEAGLGPGSPLLLLATANGIVVLTRQQARQRLRAQLDGPSLVEELIDERRRAAAAEDE
jgi:AbrB family looped-hinge helix DNA binding protein